MIDIAEGIVCSNYTRQLHNLNDKVVRLRNKAWQTVKSVQTKRVDVSENIGQKKIKIMLILVLIIGFK